MSHSALDFAFYRGIVLRLTSKVSAQTEDDVGVNTLLVHFTAFCIFKLC